MATRLVESRLMAALIVDHNNAELSVASRDILKLRYGNDETHRVGVHAINQIVLTGDIIISTQVLRTCLSNHIDIVLLPRRGKKPVLNIWPTAARGSALRHQQHLSYAAPEQRLQLASFLVQAKIERQMAWLEAHGISLPLENFQKAAMEANNVASLYGIEGAASARYFEYWGKLWQSPWSFTTRNRRPPRDPINGLLSLSYTMALGYVGRLLVLSGLDLTFGFLHGPQRERPSLALDLLEPLRPRIDHWIWWLLNETKALAPEHFSTNDGDGCRLTKAGRGIYFSHWYRAEENWLHSLARTVLASFIKKLRSIN